MAVTGKTYEQIYKTALLYAQIHSDVAFDATDPDFGMPKLIYESILEEWEMAGTRKPFNRLTSMNEPVMPNPPPIPPATETSLSQYLAPNFDWYIEYKLVCALTAVKLAMLSNKQSQSAQQWHQQVLQEYQFQMKRIYPGKD
jgi:hypothetical protein